mmetsp:Transcript_127162/g.231039  ORF Transcript_127162/g.231039 Transcript_127162/m.231039 type:complete len:325 (-) Transcript_127162:180-1154(-)
MQEESPGESQALLVDAVPRIGALRADSTMTVLPLGPSAAALRSERPALAGPLGHPALGRDAVASDEVGTWRTSSPVDPTMLTASGVAPLRPLRRSTTPSHPIMREATGLLALFAPENGICFAMLKRLGPFELSALGAISRHFRRLMDDPTIDPFWARFYGHHFHMTDQDAGEYINLRPKQIFSRLASLSISGKWHVTGRVTQMEQEVENAYGYIQFFTERERLSPIESSFEGEVEDDESAFLVEGKMVGNSVVMYETITNHSNVPIAVNICSGVLSLRGGFMSGVWTQHNPSTTRVLSGTISSGIFEATKLEDVGARPGTTVVA